LYRLPSGNPGRGTRALAARHVPECRRRATGASLDASRRRQGALCSKIDMPPPPAADTVTAHHEDQTPRRQVLSLPNSNYPIILPPPARGKRVRRLVQLIGGERSTPAAVATRGGCLPRLRQKQCPSDHSWRTPAQARTLPALLGMRQTVAHGRPCVPRLRQKQCPSDRIPSDPPSNHPAC